MEVPRALPLGLHKLPKCNHFCLIAQATHWTIPTVWSILLVSSFHISYYPIENPWVAASAIWEFLANLRRGKVKAEVSGGKR